MSLAGRVCVVTGASRGIGKGIALQLGSEGATVYITGRTLKAKDGAKGSLEETAREVESRGGVCIPIQCDHSNAQDIEALFKTVAEQQNGRLDLLVNNAYSALNFYLDNINKKFHEMPPETFEVFTTVGLRNHYYCAVHAARLMVPQQHGLIVWISSRAGLRYFHSVPLGICKASLDKMAMDCGAELRDDHIACVSVWPGATGTENITTARDDTTKDDRVHNQLVTMFKNTESTEYTGKGVVALLKDKNVMRKSGKVVISADLGDEYGFVDIDGKKPANMSSLAYALERAGYSFLARFIPRWIKIPKWFIWQQASKF